MNILISSVGRRSYLVRYFREALAGCGEVIAINSHSAATGLDAADRAFIVPPSSAPDYAQTVAGLCRQFEIGLHCSCHDLDILALAPERERLLPAGGITLLPNQEWAELCLDKFECGKRLQAAGFGVPWTALSLEATEAALASGEVAFPLVIKARRGFGSLDMVLCRDRQELHALYPLAQASQRRSAIADFLACQPEAAVVIQEHIAGKEFCLTLVNNLRGEFAAAFLAEVHEMRAGESDRVTTVAPDFLGDLPRRLSQLTRHAGIWGVDLLMNGETPTIIDINPRFTGDYPFQHLAGANIPATLIAWAEGKEPDPQWLNPAVDLKACKELVPVRSATPGAPEWQAAACGQSIAVQDRTET